MSDGDLQQSRLRLLLGFTGTSAISEPGLHPSLVASYRLRVVALGTLITTALLLNMVLFVAISAAISFDDPAFLAFALVGIGLLGAVVVLPWNRILVTKWALKVLYGWSIATLTVAGLGVYATGGGSSVMFLAFPVLAVFFAIAYPQRAQVSLLVLGVAIYALALVAAGWSMPAADFVVRVFALVAMAYVASVLSGWLVVEMRNRAVSTSEAEQRREMLNTVARAARRIGSLDSSRVLSGALTGAIELGSRLAEIWLVPTDGGDLTLQRRVSTDSSTSDAELANRLFARLVTDGGSQVEGDHVASLLYKEGEPTGLLVVGAGEGTVSREPALAECVDLIAAQVSAALDVARGVAERKGFEERLAHWAFHDALTDLPNRVLFADRLELALARSSRDHSKLAVLFLDLDEFKKINDTLGHGAGDDLLKAAAKRIQGCLRPNDTLARYGGDEFVILVEQIDTEAAATAVAQRILDSLVAPVAAGSEPVTIKTSIGIAITEYREGADIDVVRRADMAMYEAKAHGGSIFVVAATD